MSVLLKESENDLGGRIASSDLLAPCDLSRKRCFRTTHGFIARRDVSSLELPRSELQNDTRTV